MKHGHFEDVFPFRNGDVPIKNGDFRALKMVIFQPAMLVFGSEQKSSR